MPTLLVRAGRALVVRTGRALVLAAIPLLGAGCVSDTGLYRWGDYEDTVFEVCSTPGGFDTGRAIARLEQLIERARASQRGIPPGAHAFLGYLYSTTGNVDAAAAALLSERELYPESAHFVDGLLERMGVDSPPEPDWEPLP